MTNDLEAQRTRQRRESAEADAHDAFLGVYQGGKSIKDVIARHVDPHTSVQVIVSRIDPDVATRSRWFSRRVSHRRLTSRLSVWSPLLWQASMPVGRGPTNAVSTRVCTGLFGPRH